MQKQTVEFVVARKNGVINKIGRASIYQPRTNFKAGSVKWYEDRPKQTGR